jgi:hypothetical protein
MHLAPLLGFRIYTASELGYNANRTQIFQSMAGLITENSLPVGGYGG